ncbi:hypothetical protein N568_0101010 [Lactococcus garvieae TRF1]|uniref:Uncharacterized protein n=1 Tax=Lactococcus garvieae TRF1 TaxID=1380772 RepID=V8AU33_9LACT|nr:hypothetical protein N568_0101010 [Lactococcus garvieae TRF1]
MMTKEFREIKDTLEKELAVYGILELIEHVSDHEYRAYDVCLNIDFDDPDLSCIDVYAFVNGTFKLAKKCNSFFVEELEELQKVVSIFYGSPFSLDIERINVIWPRYSIEIPTLTFNSLSELVEHVRVLKILLNKVPRK